MSFLVSRFCALSYLGANCCAMWVLFSVFSIVEGSAPDASVLLLWLLCLGTCSLGLPLFLRRERSERALI